jgi:hypothetical protein
VAAPFVSVQRTAARMSRKGKVAIRLTCLSSSQCVGTMKIVLPLRHGKRMTLGRAKFTIPGKAHRTLHVTLTKAGRKAITRRRGATVLAHVTTRDSTGHATTRTSGLLLKTH